MSTKLTCGTITIEKQAYDRTDIADVYIPLRVQERTAELPKNVNIVSSIAQSPSTS